MVRACPVTTRSWLLLGMLALQLIVPRTAAASDLPDASKTPGKLDPALTKDVVCARNFRTVKYRDVEDSTKKATCKAYGLSEDCDAKEAYELYLDSYRKHRAAWPQVLVAQRTYFQISVEYTESLADLRSAEVAILGLLLVDGLNEPPNVPSAGQPGQRENGLPEPINGRAGRGLDSRGGGHD